MSGDRKKMQMKVTENDIYTQYEFIRNLILEKLVDFLHRAYLVIV